jgi:hypothetical protein
MRTILFLSGLLAAATARAETVWATPHEQYSSSIGVLGCKVDTNRIAYWPASVDCNNICVSLSYEGRTVHLLRIDQSQGAYDVSYDAWNYLVTGFSATERPTAGGAIAMEYQDADASACADLIHTDDHKLPLSASNSMNYLASCLATDTWVGRNHVLYNILDPICLWGNDEVCNLDWPTANQAACPTQIGTPSVLTNTPVYNIEYVTGNRYVAGSGEVVASGGASITPPLNLSQKSGGWVARGDRVMMAVIGVFTYWLLCGI